MPKSILERIDAVVTVLELLSADMEILRNGAEALRVSLPRAYGAQRLLLHEHAAALERVSIGLAMVQNSVSSLGEIRDHGRVIMNEAQTLALTKNGFNMVLASHDQPENRRLMLVKTACRFDQCIARIREAAAALAGKVPSAAPANSAPPSPSCPRSRK